MSTTLDNQHTITYDDDLDLLIDELHAWGIDYLVGGSHPSVAKVHLPVVELIIRLAQCKHPRVRDASISLFLLHPELTDALLKAYQKAEPGVAEQIAVLTLATLYLRRLWAFRLALAFGSPPVFPEQPFAHLWQSRKLPSPSCQQGEIGLASLQAAEQRRRGLPLNFIGDWQNQIDHLLAQEEARHHNRIAPVGILKLQNEKETRECSEMSMRGNATKADIEKFLNSLGKIFRKPGRIYLAGGAALVHMGIRSGSTLDIDVVIETTAEDEMVKAIRKLMEQMQLNIEFSSPGDFIPLPAQWTAHAKYIGRYGSLDAFYFDFYSLALSKISRGSDRDLIDVKLLVQGKIITLEELDAAYQEVLPRMGKRPFINLDPQKFAGRYAVVRQQLQQLD